MLVSGITPVSNLAGIQATTVEAAVSKKQIAKFVRAVDGDTAKLSVKGTTYTFRFLAIDTPETVKPNTPPAFMGKKASNYTKYRLFFSQSNDTIIPWIIAPVCVVKEE